MWGTDAAYTVNVSVFAEGLLTDEIFTDWWQTLRSSPLRDYDCWHSQASTSRLECERLEGDRFGFLQLK